MLAGAGAGAVFGGLQGASDAKDLTNIGDTARRAGIGATVGGILGASIPAIGQGIGAAYRGIANRVSGGVEDVSRQAAPHLLDAIKADGPQTVSDNLARLGPDAVLADAGPSLLGVAQGVATRPGEAKSALVQALTQRNQGTNARLAGDVDSALGPAASAIKATQDIRSARGVEHQDLPAVFKNAPDVDVSSVLNNINARLLRAEGPEKKALLSARDMLTQQVQGPGGILLMPKTNAENISNVKVALDKLIKYGDDNLGIPAGALEKANGAAAGVRSDINDALRTQVPGYAGVMDKSSALAKQGEALERGTQLLGNGHENHPAIVDQFLQKLQTPEQKQALAAGVRAEIDRQVGTKANDLQALKSGLKGEGDWNKENLSKVFGSDNTGKVFGAVDRESHFRDTFNKVAENSQTAQRQAAAGALGSNPMQVPARDTLYGDVKAIAMKPVNALLGQLLTKDTAARDGELAKILASSGPERGAYLTALANALQKREANSATGKKVGDAAALAAAIMASRERNERLPRAQ